MINLTQIIKAIQFAIKAFTRKGSAEIKNQQAQSSNINIYITNNQGETKKDDG